MHPFRAAIEDWDLDAVTSLLADDVVFRSPIVSRPYRGPVAVRAILAAVSRVFEDFSYLREIGAPEARDHALVFQARVGDKQLEGCDFLHADERGLIDQARGHGAAVIRRARAGSGDEGGGFASTESR